MKITATWLEKAKTKVFLGPTNLKIDRKQERVRRGKAGEEKKKILLFTLRSGAEQIPETKLFKSNIIG